ncbi:response regulator transcription factor [Marihabitans asiaticum]|uniref:Two-component system response regulator DesR n=1 Tax=Marihabitans asiaticum TaxID=415218 RepID=A0A560WGZ7_9MICO|nr:LuxR C-terminal-related transcriptional regulator [Marihabitans asiaticum]TWD16947.1 two-component system response regulator DesR [Marihabitans asiaticum]
MTIRVVVADPDPCSRRGWIALLEAEKGIEPIGVGDVGDVLERSGEASCAMLVRDPATDLPHELIGTLKTDFSVPTLVVICESDPSHAAEALDAGAAGVLVADATPTQVVDAVRAACAGRSVEGDTGLIPVTGPLVATRAHEASPLTERELQILALADEGLTNPQIAGRTYLSLSAVKSHLTHAFGRLGVRHRAAAIAEARRRGLLP